ncbi:MAG: hypothetical protein WED07_05520 [Candidatus Freyarchaeum deiterrae]
MVIEGEPSINSAIDATKLIDKTLNQIKTKLGEKDAELVRLRIEIENIKKMEKANIEMKKENIEMKEELQGIKNQLSKISTMYSDLSKKKDEAIDVRELLTIYVTLLEQVFAGMPHARVLWLLHGAKTTLTREEITKTSGFQPAVILKSIFDLQNSKLVQYDTNSQNVKLSRKLY